MRYTRLNVPKSDMNFFEVTTPYYALIRANNREDALEAYMESVAEVDDEDLGRLLSSTKQVNRDYVRYRFELIFFTKLEDIIDGDLLDIQMNRILNTNTNEILLVDAELV